MIIVVYLLADPTRTQGVVEVVGALTGALGRGTPPAEPQQIVLTTSPAIVGMPYSSPLSIPGNRNPNLHSMPPPTPQAPHDMSSMALRPRLANAQYHSEDAKSTAANTGVTNLEVQTQSTLNPNPSVL